MVKLKIKNLREMKLLLFYLLSDKREDKLKAKPFIIKVKRTKFPESKR